MSKINETNYPRRTQANYADTDMLVLQAAGGNTYTTRMEDMRDDYEATLAPTINKINDALAPAENGATASQSYAIGEHFMRDGAFCTAIAAITSGGSFTLNTNYKVDDVANNLEQLNSDIANLFVKKAYSGTTSQNGNLNVLNSTEGSRYKILSVTCKNSSDTTPYVAIPYNYGKTYDLDSLVGIHVFSDLAAQTAVTNTAVEGYLYMIDASISLKTIT